MTIGYVEALDIRRAVEYGVKCIHANPMVLYKNFFLETQFGRIPVETKPSTRKIEVNVYDFNGAPGTQFVLANRRADLKWYVELTYKPTQKEEVTRALLVVGLMKILITEVIGTDVKMNSLAMTSACFNYYNSYCEPVEIVIVVEEVTKSKVGVIRGKAFENYNDILFRNVRDLKKKSEEFLEFATTDYSKYVPWSSDASGLDVFHRNLAHICLAEADAGLSFGELKQEEIAAILGKFGVKPRNSGKNVEEKTSNKK